MQTIIKKIFIYKKFLKRFYEKIINLLTLHIPRAATFNLWPTKDYEIWLLLQFILFIEKPKKLLELGSGRSTHYLAEYNQKFGGEFFSIEENFMFVFKNWLGLKLSYLSNFRLFYIPIKNNWFSLRKLSKINFIKNADFVFIDAPGGATNRIDKGSRCSANAISYMLENFGTTKTIVIDDLQCEEALIFCQSYLKLRNDLYFLLLKYRQDRIILFCIKNINKDKYLEFLKLSQISNSLLYSHSDFDKVDNYIISNGLLIE